jgi:hypothetical protein
MVADSQRTYIRDQGFSVCPEGCAVSSRPPLCTVYKRSRDVKWLQHPAWRFLWPAQARSMDRLPLAAPVGYFARCAFVGCNPAIAGIGCSDLHAVSFHLLAQQRC